MPYDPTVHGRRSVRLDGYDYARAGAYLVTICTHDRLPLFGDTLNGECVLTELGLIAEEEWLAAERLRAYVALDYFVIMPNHVHGIVVLTGSDEGRGVARYAPTDRAQSEFRSPHSGTLGAIVRSSKSAVTKRINEARRTPGHVVWQARYHDHIVRDDKDLRRIRTYIVNNPRRWQYDHENPNNIQ